MKIAIVADHAGFELKQQLMRFYDNLIDLGTNSEERCDFTDFGNKLAETVLSGQADLGIAICGTGIGMSMAVNRHKGIRGAVLYDNAVAKWSKEHNNANVIIFGSRTMTVDEVRKRIDIFLNSKFLGDRYAIRNAKLDD